MAINNIASTPIINGKYFFVCAGGGVGFGIATQCPEKFELLKYECQ